jgi:4-hydroxyacetophenone monooxygenase
MQLVPAIVDEVSSLTIFQRSAQWVAPFEKFHAPIPDEQRYLFRDVPPYEVWYRLRLGWIFDNQVYPALQKDPAWPHPDRSVNAVSDTYRRFFTRYILSELGDRKDLADVVVPTYPPFGKRMLLDNGWFRALVKDQVELVTATVSEIVESGVRTEDGSLYEADVLVFATGFDVVRFLAPIEIRGRSGETLRTTWDDDNPRAYLGMTVPDFPNFFMLYGPNTQAGHGGSLIFVIESQVHYICNLLEQMFEAGWASVECRADVHDRYNETVDAMHENMVWTHPGMDVYYRNRRGRVVVNSPFRGVDFWKMTQRANLSDYNLESSRRGALRSSQVSEG